MFPSIFEQLPQKSCWHTHGPSKYHTGSRGVTFCYYLLRNKKFTNNIQQANSLPVITELKVILLGNRHDQGIPPILNIHSMMKVC